MKHIKNYYTPTDSKWRKLGDTLLAVSTFITTYSIHNEMDQLALAAVIIGSVGKFITNFFEPTEV